EPERRLATPVFSPDGGRIAFVALAASNQIWISPVTGGPPVRLTRSETIEFSPTWSPDGKWIAYLTTAESQFALVKMRVGSTGTPVILRKATSTSLAQPQWSPAGDWITDLRPEALLLVSPDGLQVRNLDKPDSPAYVWSRDGSALYGVRGRDV